jgi:hypothetical protein
MVLVLALNFCSWLVIALTDFIKYSNCVFTLVPDWNYVLIVLPTMVAELNQL